MDCALEAQFIDNGDSWSLLQMYFKHSTTLAPMQALTLWCRFDDNDFVQVTNDEATFNTVPADEALSWIDTPCSYRWCAPEHLPTAMRSLHSGGCLVGAKKTEHATCILIGFTDSNDAQYHASTEAAFEHYLTHLYRASCIGQMGTQQKYIDNLQQQLSKNECMSALGEMVGAVTHEINNPMGVAITGLSHLKCEVKRLVKDFEEGALTEVSFGEFVEECTDCCHLLEFNLERAVTLLKGFKNTAVDQCASQQCMFDVGENIRNLMLSISPEIKRQGIDLEVSLPENPVYINGYPGAVSQIITNLSFNAMRHAFEHTTHPRICMSGKLDPRLATFTLIFEDNGSGIPREIQDAIFTAYFTTKTGCGGSGLGMSIAKELAEVKLGGTLVLDPDFTSGARFIMCVPIANQ